jgi:hypothetical protein
MSPFRLFWACRWWRQRTKDSSLERRQIILGRFLHDVQVNPLIRMAKPVDGCANLMPWLIGVNSCTVFPEPYGRFADNEKLALDAGNRFGSWRNASKAAVLGESKTVCFGAWATPLVGSIRRLFTLHLVRKPLRGLQLGSCGLGKALPLNLMDAVFKVTGRQLLSVSSTQSRPRFERQRRRRSCRFPRKGCARFRRHASQQILVAVEHLHTFDDRRVRPGPHRPRRHTEPAQSPAPVAGFTIGCSTCPGASSQLPFA